MRLFSIGRYELCVGPIQTSIGAQLLKKAFWGLVTLASMLTKASASFQTDVYTHFKESNLTIQTRFDRFDDAAIEYYKQAVVKHGAQLIAGPDSPWFFPEAMRICKYKVIEYENSFLSTITFIVNNLTSVFNTSAFEQSRKLAIDTCDWARIDIVSAGLKLIVFCIGVGSGLMFIFPIYTSLPRSLIQQPLSIQARLRILTLFVTTGIVSALTSNIHDSSAITLFGRGLLVPLPATLLLAKEQGIFHRPLEQQAPANVEEDEDKDEENPSARLLN